MEPYQQQLISIYISHVGICQIFLNINTGWFGQSENINNVNEIKHQAVKYLLKYLKIKKD